MVLFSSSVLVFCWSPFCCFFVFLFSFCIKQFSNVLLAFLLDLGLRRRSSVDTALLPVWPLAVRRICFPHFVCTIPVNTRSCSWLTLRVWSMLFSRSFPAWVLLATHSLSGICMLIFSVLWNDWFLRVPLVIFFVLIWRIELFYPMDVGLNSISVV